MFDIHSLNHNNRLWYIQVGENRYYNDVAAFMAWCRDRKQKLEFVLDFPKLYASNWNVEPTEDIIQLEDRMVKYLANRYDKIYVLYSGGSDSHSIMTALMRNNVHNVTLVYHQTPLKLQKSDFKRRHELTHVMHALQRYKQWMADHNWKVELQQTNDIDRNQYKQTAISDIDIGRHFRWKDFYLPTNFSLLDKNLKTLDTSIWKNHKRACVLTGNEKPNVFPRDGKWVWQMLIDDFDASPDWVNPMIEQHHFYINDIIPELHIKKAHIKIQITEDICRQKGIKIKHNDTWMNSATSEHYQRINHGMGYCAITPILDGSFSKVGGGIYEGDIELYNNTYNLNPLRDDMSKNLLSVIDSDLIEENGQLNGIWSREIPICDVSKDVQ